MADSLPFGSAAWTSGEEYGGEYAERINLFINKINKKALLSYASLLRGNQPCIVSNLVRKIRFDDDVEWIGSWIATPTARERMLLDMQSELATMEFPFHNQNTEIPIPRVYAYDLNDQNTVGCPFSIIEYVDGNTAEEVSRTYPGEHEGIPAQFEEKFWRQVAKIMLVETGSGPYNSAAEFYADYPLALTLVGDGSAEGFGLANYDLNPNNFLVDREFNVLAVIDWDSVVSGPDAALYRFPFLMGVSCAVPGVVDTHPAVMKREQLGRRFAKVVEEVGQDKAGNDCEGANKWPTHLLAKSGFFSKEAVAFRSLIYVKMRQDCVNNTWLQGLKWLSEHNEVQVAQFYHRG
ncbi:hypothetical protein F5Y10DRAFT_280901 [Nemania abortiva]|nr:hypothetical protein F5Y10DRAFT_280901 [Nemania abortiva]